MEHPDVSFLKDQEISAILTKGLSHLYQTQPKQPIDYLAKWLLNINGNFLSRNAKEGTCH